MKRNHDLFVSDILEAIQSIETFIKGIDYKTFVSDIKTRSAVVWQVHIIGEATKNIPKSIRIKYEDIPWKDMAGIRDKINHFYFGIDYEVVWEVINKKLPFLKPKIEQVLEDMRK